jgi:hypothetical protein
VIVAPGIPAPVASRTTPVIRLSGCPHAGGVKVRATSATAIAGREVMASLL